VSQTDRAAPPRRIKICGIARADQGRAIAAAGATALGFICVRQSRRYVPPSQIGAIATQLPPGVDRVGVFADASIAAIAQTVALGRLSGVQLHGSETPAFCQALRRQLPATELIKTLTVSAPADLAQAAAYVPVVDALLLDAYHPQLAGGTGRPLDWQTLSAFDPGCPWLLAGGLTPQNIGQALSLLQPDGIDLSSGVERAPGDKDLALVSQLFASLRAGR